MIPREILKKNRQIELRTNRLVNETPAGALFQPHFQIRWIPRSMENRQHCKSVIFNREIDRISFESGKANSLRASANSLKTFGIIERPFEREFYLELKFTTETRTLSLIPSHSLLKLQTRCRLENDRQAHCQPKRLLRSASTCSHGIPSAGFFSKSARRRSNSAACSGVSSGLHPSSTMISQKSCASLIRSACGSAFAASRISDAFIDSSLPANHLFASA